MDMSLPFISHLESEFQQNLFKKSISGAFSQRNVRTLRTVNLTA